MQDDVVVERHVDARSTIRRRVKSSLLYDEEKQLCDMLFSFASTATIPASASHKYCFLRGECLR